MSLAWNSGLRQCPNHEHGCGRKFLTEQELEEHRSQCTYTYRERSGSLSVVLKSVKKLEDRMERMDGAEVESLMRRVELLEIKSRGSQGTSLEVGDIRDRLVEMEASNQIIREETCRLKEQENRISALFTQLRRLENSQGGSSERNEPNSGQLSVLESKYHELQTSHQQVVAELSELREAVKKGALGGRRPYKDSAGVTEESVQTQIAELRRKQRSELRSVEEQMDSLTHATNNTSMDLRKLRMKLGSEVQAELSELKQEVDKVRRSCWSMEGQLEGRRGAKGQEREKGQDVSKEMVNQLMDEMGVFDSARDMDVISVEFKLLQTKVDLMEETQRGLKLKLRSQEMEPTSGARTIGEDESLDKLFEEIRKLKTSLAVTNTELQAGFKRADNRMEGVEVQIRETQELLEHVRNPSNSRISRVEKQLNELETQFTQQVATPVIPVLTYEKQIHSLREELRVKLSHETSDIKRDMEESNELNRDSFDVIQQKCNSLYSESNSLNKKLDQISRQVASKSLVPTVIPASDKQVSHLEQDVRELQESYDSRLTENKKQRDEMSASIEGVWQELEQIQSGFLSLDKQVREVCGENGVQRRVVEIEEFLHRDLPSMGVTTSQKATLEKLVEERSDSVKALLTEKIAEQLVEMRKIIPDISDLKQQVEELKKKSRRQGSDPSAQRSAAERELDEKMEKFKRQVWDLDQNAAKIFQSLSADMQKLAPKIDTAQQERVSALEREISELKDVVRRLAKQETQPKLPIRQPDSLHSSSSDLASSHQSDLPPQPPPKSALALRTQFSNTPPVPSSSIRAPSTPAPSDAYSIELVRRASERSPVSGERIMRIIRVLKTISDQSTIISDPFASAQNGYQFRVQACLLPSQSGVRVKVALEVLSGEFDEELQWPVEGTIRYYVLNQIHDFAHIHLDDSFFFNRPSRTPIPLKSSFLTVPSTDASGPYCFNNSLFIRAQIINLSNVC